MSTGASPVIEAQGLSVSVGQARLLHGLSFRVHPGERVALVGHNGAGKSTLLRALSGFMAVTQGHLRVLDAALDTPLRGAALRHLRCRVAQVHQGLHLVDRLNVLDNVLIGAAARHASSLTWLRCWPASERRTALQALERVGMAWAALRRTDSLSGGERQKVAIARALHQSAPPGPQGGDVRLRRRGEQGSAAPEFILLADEPTANLDADAADEVLSLLAGVASERRATLICVVHDLDLLPRLAQRALVLRRGALVADVAVTPQTPTQLRGLLK